MRIFLRFLLGFTLLLGGVELGVAQVAPTAACCCGDEDACPCPPPPTPTAPRCPTTASPSLATPATAPKPAQQAQRRTQPRPCPAPAPIIRLQPRTTGLAAEAQGYPRPPGASARLSLLRTFRI